MASKPPTTIAAHIEAAPAVGQPHLRRLHALLKRIAPDAGEAIKWGNPFFIEPPPEALIRKIAKRRVRDVSRRTDDSFWEPGTAD